MKFHPPIIERGKDELIEIANFPDKWQPETVEQAKAELVRRGVSSQEQEKKIEKWIRDSKAELKCEMKKRALVKYQPIELFFMFIRLPATLLWGWNLKREGYIKLHKQRLSVIALGLLFYFCSILYISWSAPVTEKARLKLIQEQDISEWEKSYYGETRDSIEVKNPSR
ncbi:hypothetical protein [Pontibacter anaerobius]|uniref:Uncharacterized protein n=1 Tax=Pontibacter anaerobius TaxID=2993940 RepID=A0ABT3RAG5_9BACT|nr:hypothetical protein [Pontibacter anaerobius]MCX2738851.1 hypothetical protein [Pontibacter anaerobius]